MNRLHPLERWVRGFESTRGIDVSVYSVFVLGSGLASS
jgi:hypothetical protein